MVEAYSDRAHTGSAVLDIGEDIGALIIYTREELRGREIEVSPKGNHARRIHTAVLERRANGRPVFAALFLALPAGDYTIWGNAKNADEVTIAGGTVAEVDWRGIPDALPPYAGLPHGYGSAIPGAGPQMLPPRYRNGKVVSNAPMGSAPLRYADDGRVAWDEIWTDFCDLALAGGPPHRGTVLEPASAEDVAADPAAYERVIAEIERGFRLVTGRPMIRGERPGWVGLRCDDEEMACWLLQAIEVENVSVRREGRVLLLPAGPTFRLDKEIKNVVTVVAKTHHYWMEHRYS